MLCAVAACGRGHGRRVAGATALVRDARKAQKKAPTARLLTGGRVPKEVQDALLFDRKLDIAVEREQKRLGVDKLTPRQEFEIAARVLDVHDPSVRRRRHLEGDATVRRGSTPSPTCQSRG